MKNEYQKILEEINTMAQKTQASDTEDARKEKEARQRYDLALAKKQTALDAGDREQYKVAGLEAEAARLDVDFFEKFKAMNNKPGASREDDTRILAALRAEANETMIDALAQLTQIFSEACDVCSSAIAKFDVINAAGEKWNVSVMKKGKGNFVVRTEDRLAMTQFKNTANGNIEKIKYINEIRPKLRG